MTLVPRTLENKLQTMAGKRYVYKQKIVTVSSARVNGERVEVLIEGNNGAAMTFPLRVAEKKLSEFVLAPPEEKVAVELYQANGVAQTLRDAGLNAIVQLKTDANFIPQALAINAILRTMIDMGKIEIEARRLERELRG